MSAAMLMLGLLWPATIFYATMAAYAAFDNPIKE